MTENTKARVRWDQDLALLNPRVAESYRQWLAYFMKRWSIADEETLYELRRSHLRSDDTRDIRQIESMCKTLMFELFRRDKSPLKPETLSALAKALKHFFNSQGLDFRVSRKDQPKGESVGQRLALREDIIQLLDSSGLEMKIRNRALIMIAKDTGLRVSDISALNVGDYRGAETVKSEGEAFKVFQPIRTVKTKSIAYPRIGPESVKAIDAYLEEREVVRRLISVDPLFVSRDGERMRGGFISVLLMRMAAHNKNPRRLSAHSLRKFNQTMLEMGDVPKNWIAKLQGKKIGDSTSSYSLSEEVPGALTDSYIKAYPKLRVYDNNDFAQKEEFKTLKSDVDDIKGLLFEYFRNGPMSAEARDKLEIISVENILGKNWDKKGKFTP